MGAIQEDLESRRGMDAVPVWFSAKIDMKVRHFKFWQDGNEAKEIISSSFLQQKLDYIHQNPVRAEIVAEPEYYLYSSAANYAGEKGLLEVLLAD